MIFELPDIFFGSHKKRKGITTTAGETVRIYKKGRKSLTTSGFFKKSGDIFFGATSQNKNSTLLGAVFVQPVKELPKRPCFWYNKGDGVISWKTGEKMHGES